MVYITLPTGCAKWTSVFDLKNVLESWKACLRPRPYYKRTLIWLCIGIFCVEIFVIVSWVLYYHLVRNLPRNRIQFFEMTQALIETPTWLTSSNTSAWHILTIDIPFDFWSPCSEVSFIAQDKNNYRTGTDNTLPIKMGRVSRT